jgi:ABC-type Na+ efflux pump permease subunit
MKRMLHVARREFMATIATKGFIIGVLLTPAMIGLLFIAMPRLMNERQPVIEGHVAILDPTGVVADSLRSWLAPEAITLRRAEQAREAQEMTPESLKALAAASGQDEASRRALEAALGAVPRLEVVKLAAGVDLDNEKQPLKAKELAPGGRIALVVVQPNAVTRAGPAGDYGSYELFVRRKLDDRIADEIHTGLRNAIVGARLAAAGLDRSGIEALTRVPRVRATTVTGMGERAINEDFYQLLPVGFMLLLLVSVLTSGQQLMTTTIEEKSSRVVEILLSAVTPMQLMTGKILGQMAVGLVILGLYAGIGSAALVSFAMFGFIDPWLFLYLVIFYLIAFFVLASIMAAIGSAVNELREAQTLMTPVMMMVMIPWLLWLPISRDPNSTFSTVISFIPPINTFTMLLRMTSTNPPPLWQVWLTIGIGVLSVYAALWFATKVFRIGLLMFGKPPNFATLVRWARMA